MTEDQIIAYVDGELGPIVALRFERAMEADPALADAVQRHRALSDRIGGHFAPIAEEPVPARLAATLDRSGNIVAFPANPRRWFGSGGRYAAIAATLVVGLVVGQMLPRGPAAPMVDRNGAVVAQGALADALDSQLASAPGEGAYRVGVSFVSHDKHYCRTFSGAAGAGLGCHGVDGWTLKRFIAGSGSTGQGAYSQAGSESAEILGAAQEMMAGDPLDSAGERRARDGGWQAP